MSTLLPTYFRSSFPSLWSRKFVRSRLFAVRQLSSVAMDEHIDCWKCHRQHSYELFCPSCKSIQCTNCTTKKLNYFQMMKNEVTFDVSMDTIKKYYIRLQSMLHPDRFVNGTEMEQDYSTTQSALVNNAYKTLSDPLTRGLYMLTLNGLELDSEGIESSDTKLLNSIFMLNFKVEESDDIDELKQLQKEVNQCLEMDRLDISEAFRNGNLDEARDSLVRMNYRTNIKTLIEDKIFELSY